MSVCERHSSFSQYILELCRGERLLEPQVIMSLLSKVTPLCLTLIDVSVHTLEEFTFLCSTADFHFMKYIKFYIWALLQWCDAVRSYFIPSLTIQFLTYCVIIISKPTNTILNVCAHIADETIRRGGRGCLFS